MTEREKALGYLQMLKNEGQLDETALPQLQEMYNLSHEEANDLLHGFKNTAEYKLSLSKNLRSTASNFIVYAALAGCFAYISFGKNGSGLFSIHFLLIGLAAFGILVYGFRLVDERYQLSSRYSWLNSKSIPYLLFAFLFFSYTQYFYSKKLYLAQPADWVELPKMVLSEDCVERSTGGRSSGHYYQLMLDNYASAFKYDKSQHLYSFKSDFPSKALKKGDTVQLWVEKNEDPELQLSSHNKVWDIEKDGRKFLDLQKRNQLAELGAERERNIAGLLLLVAFVFSALVKPRSPGEPT